MTTLNLSGRYLAGKLINADGTNFDLAPPPITSISQGIASSNLVSANISSSITSAGAGLKNATQAFENAVTQLNIALAVRDDVQNQSKASAASVATAQSKVHTLVAAIEHAQLSAKIAQTNFNVATINVTSAEDKATAARNVLTQLQDGQAASGKFDQKIIDDAIAVEKNAEANAVALRIEADAQQKEVTRLNERVQEVRTNLDIANSDLQEHTALIVKANYGSVLAQVVASVEQATDQVNAAQMNVENAQVAVQNNQSNLTAANDQAQSMIASADQVVIDAKAALNTVAAGAEAAEAVRNTMATMLTAAENSAAQTRVQADQARAVAEASALQVATQATATKYSADQISRQNSLWEYGKTQLVWLANNGMTNSMHTGVVASFKTQLDAMIKANQTVQSSTVDLRAQSDSDQATAAALLAAYNASTIEISKFQEGLTKAEADLTFVQQEALNTKNYVTLVGSQAEAVRAQAEKTAAMGQALSDLSAAELESSLAQAAAAMQQLQAAEVNKSSIESEIENLDARTQETQSKYLALFVEEMQISTLASSAGARSESAAIFASDARNQEVAAEEVLAQLLAIQSSESVNLQLIEDARSLLAFSQSATEELTATAQTLQSQADTAQAAVITLAGEVASAQAQAEDAQAQAAAGVAQVDAANAAVQEATALLAAAKDAMIQAEIDSFEPVVARCGVSDEIVKEWKAPSDFILPLTVVNPVLIGNVLERNISSLPEVLTVLRDYMANVGNNVAISVDAFTNASAQLNTAIEVQNSIQNLSNASAATAQDAATLAGIWKAEAAQAQVNAQQAQDDYSTTLANAATAQEQANSAQNVLLQLTAAQAQTDSFDQQVIDDAAALERNAEANAVALRTQADLQRNEVAELSKAAQEIQAQLAAAQEAANDAQVNATTFRGYLVGAQDFVQSANTIATTAQNNVATAQENLVQTQNQLVVVSNQAQNLIAQSDATVAATISVLATAQSGAQAAAATVNILSSVQEAANAALAAARVQAVATKDYATKQTNQVTAISRLAATTQEQVRLSNAQVVVAQANLAVAQSAVTQLVADQVVDPDAVEAWVIDDATADLAATERNAANSIALAQANAERLARLQATLDTLKSAATNAQVQAVESQAAYVATQVDLAEVVADLQHAQTQATSAQEAVVVAQSDVVVAQTQAVEVQAQAQNMQEMAQSAEAVSSAQLADSLAQASAALAQLNFAISNQAVAQSHVEATDLAAQETAAQAATLATQATGLATVAGAAKQRSENAQALALDAQNKEAAAEAVLANLLEVQKSNPNAANLQLIEDARALLAVSLQATAALTADATAQLANVDQAQAAAADAQTQANAAQIAATDAQAQADDAQAQASAALDSVQNANAQLVLSKDAMNHAQLVQTESLDLITSGNIELFGSASLNADMYTDLNPLNGFGDGVLDQRSQADLAPLLGILSVGRSLMIDMEDNVSKSMGAFDSAVAQLNNARETQNNIQNLSNESSRQASDANFQLQLLTNSSATAQVNAQQARINLSTTLANAATAKEQANSAQNVLGQLTAAQAKTDAFNKQVIEDAAALESNAEAKAAAWRTEVDKAQAQVIALSKDAQATQAQ